MQQIQIPYKNSPDFLNKLLQLKNYYEDNDENELQQIFFYICWSGEVKNKLDTVIDKIEEIFPSSLYYGNEGSGHIASGDFSDGINITCYIFESKKTKAELVWVEKGSKVPSLNGLWNICNSKKNLIGIELLPTITYAEKLNIDNEVPPISENVVIFGGTACKNEIASLESYVVAKGHKKSCNAMVAILYSGEDLSISSNYVLGWQGIGKLMTVTKSTGKCIEELDGEAPMKIYEKYLGPSISNEEFNVFPLIVYEDGVEYIRTAFRFLEDETMDMFVNIPVGAKCRLSFGDRNAILDSIYEQTLNISEFRPESIRAYSCASRRIFWGNSNIGRETIFLNQIAPTCGFFSGGEILRIGNKLRILNQTLSLISMKEYNGKDIKPIKVDLQAADRTMASRLAFFTRKVTQEQEDALLFAESANKAKTEFLFNMSHDIRTPLNAIVGFTNIALREIENKEKAIECINKVKKSNEILLSIVNDILDMAKIESGEVKLSYSKINISSIFNKIEPAMTNLASTKNVNINFKVVNLEHKNVFANVTFIQRILINIISNAIKYTCDGGFVNVSLEEKESDNVDNSLYEYIIKDNGIGMSKEFQSHMFEEFAREENTTTSGIQGTGLGLPLALKLAQLMGGTIECESEEDVGSTFKVRIPMKTCDETAVDIETIKPDIKQANLEGKKALIVEDNSLNMEILLDIMKEEKIVTESATNGQIAFEMLKEKGPKYYDFILMDIQMPVMNGYEATKAIRQLYPNDKIIIIAISANAFEEDKAHSISAGMTDHIAKPININELKRIMAKYL